MRVVPDAVEFVGSADDGWGCGRHEMVKLLAKADHVGGNQPTMAIICSAARVAVTQCNLVIMSSAYLSHDMMGEFYFA